MVEPFEKYANLKLDHETPIFGVKIPKKNWIATTFLGSYYHPKQGTIRGFPKLGVPQNGWFILENPIEMDDLGVALCLETAIRGISFKTSQIIGFLQGAKLVLRRRPDHRVAAFDPTLRLRFGVLGSNVVGVGVELGDPGFLGETFFFGGDDFCCFLVDFLVLPYLFELPPPSEFFCSCHSYLPRWTVFASPFILHPEKMAGSRVQGLRWMSRKLGGATHLKNMIRIGSFLCENGKKDLKPPKRPLEWHHLNDTTWIKPTCSNVQNAPF